MPASGHYAFVKVGDTTIEIPVPKGFKEAIISPKTTKWWRTPPNIDGLALYVSDADFDRILCGQEPWLERYMSVQVLREIADMTCSEDEFRTLVATLKEKQKDIFAKAMKDNPRLYEGLSDKPTSRSSAPVEIKRFEIEPLGVFLDKTDAIGFTILGKIETEVDGQTAERSIAVTSVAVRVSQKVIYAFVGAKYKNQDDLNWVRTTATAWVDQILAENPSIHIPTPSDECPPYLIANFGCTVKFPAGWAKIPPKYMDTAAMIVGAIPGQSDACLWTGDGKGPFVFIRTIPYPAQPTPREVEEWRSSMQSRTRQDLRWSDAQTPDCYLGDTVQDVPHTGAVRCRMYAVLGTKGAVVLQCCAFEQRMDGLCSQFDQIAASMQFADAFRLPGRPSTSDGNQTGRQNDRGACLGGTIKIALWAVLAVGLVVLFVIVRRSRKESQ